MSFYFNTNSISPSKGRSGGGGSSTQIEATNNTGSAISEGDKVWINKNGNNYELVNYYSNVPNFDIIGSPTITDKVVSGFGKFSNYLILPFTIQSAFSSMDILFSFNTNILISSDSPIMSTINPVKDFFISYHQKVAYWDNGNYVEGSTVLSNNTDYLLRIIYDGTNFKYYLIQDMGYTLDNLPDISQWSLEITSTSNYFANGLFNIGSNSQDGQYFPGSIDLKKTYIKIDGIDWWTPYITNITSDTQTGIAAENIAIGGTGIVNVASGV